MDAAPEPPETTSETPTNPGPVPPTVADVLSYNTHEQASFHMPGHKQRGGYHPLAVSILGEAALRNDVSEMGGFDYLHAPEGSISEAQDRSAQIFGASATHFLVNGSTVGNLAAVLSHAGNDDTVVALRASHRSVYSAIALAGSTPHYIPIDYDVHLDGWFGATPPATLPSNTSVIHITRPNYYGMAVDLSPYRALADSVGAVLIVDEAHGTHFGADPRLPPSALQLGADIVIQSTHKTLSALTQASMLHIGVDENGRVRRHALQQSLAMLQSSSPSALLTLSLDLAAHEHARNDHSASRRVVDLAVQTRRTMHDRLEMIRLLGSSNAPRSEEVLWDPTKLVLDVHALGISGFDARSLLRSDFGVGVELADHRRIVCSLTVGDDDATAGLLIDALAALEKQSPSNGTRTSTPREAAPTPRVAAPTHAAAPTQAAAPTRAAAPTPREAAPTHAATPTQVTQVPQAPQVSHLTPVTTLTPVTIAAPTISITPRAALQRRSEPVALDASVGRVFGEYVIPYPPGIPLAAPGELVTAEAVQGIKDFLAAGARIVGPADPSLATIAVLR